MRLKTVLKSGKGFTLIEVLISTAIVTIIGVSIIGMIAVYLKYSQSAREQVQAQNIANQQMEVLRNMSYDSLATVAGAIYPPGTIADLQTVTVDNHQYKVHTYISYVDDPFDGNAAGTIVGKPTDLYPYDYKKITISVRNNLDTDILGEVTTNVASKAAETASNTGILSLRVQNSQGQPVYNAAVLVTNPNPVPSVNINTFTDVSGLVVIPNLPPSSLNDYKVTASLAGYSSDSTNPAFGPNNLNPVKPNFNILAQQITSITLAIDLVSTMQVTVRDTSGAAIPNLSLNFKGNKLTYTGPDTYKFNQNFITDASGQVTLSNLEWDSYFILVPSGYYVVSTSPYQDVVVSPGQNLNVSLVVSTSSTYPRVSSITPSSAVNNSSVNFTITGNNLVAGTTVVLRLAGQSDIVATGVASSVGDTQLSGSFNLIGAVPGNWDIVVTDPSSRVVTQTGGFTITP